MAISYSSLAASVPNWQLVTSATPSGVSTVTFSGLAGYSRYRILAPNLVPSGSASLQLRINADSGAKYNYGTIGNNNGYMGSLVSTLDTFYTAYASGASTATSQQIDIENALLLAPKFITSTFNASVSSQWLAFNGFGNYITTSALTSITLLMSANNFSTGTIYLLGAN